MGSTMEQWWDSVWLFALAFTLSATAGIFRQLTIVKRRKVIDVAIAGGYAGCTGLAISLLWYSYSPNNPTRLLGLCIISALAGATGIDQLIVLLRKVTETYDQRRRNGEQ